MQDFHCIASRYLRDRSYREITEPIHSLVDQNCHRPRGNPEDLRVQMRTNIAGVNEMFDHLNGESHSQTLLASAQQGHRNLRGAALALVVTCSGAA